MKRSTSLAAAAIATVSLLAACTESSSDPAATIDGIEISEQELVDELDAIDGNADYVAAYEASAASEGRPGIRGAEPDTFDTAFVATTLSLRMQFALLEAEVDRRQLPVDDTCRDVARTRVVERFAGASETGDGEAILDAFGEDYAGYLVDRETDFVTLQADVVGEPCALEPSDDRVEAYYEENSDLFSAETACVSHILVATGAEADAVAARLDGGEDFAAIAAELSIDTQTGPQGGDLGCTPAGAYVPEFEAAAFAQPVGEVGDPVETEFGFHLILVTERGVPEFDDVREDVVLAVQQADEVTFFEWFDEALTAAEITVDPRYGTWDPTTFNIIPPGTEPAQTEPAPEIETDTSEG